MRRPIVKVFTIKLSPMWIAECLRCPWRASFRDFPKTIAAADGHARTHRP